MPNFKTHIAASSVTSALLVAFGAARFGWDGATPALAFAAGAVGGLVPDLDHDNSKPLRLAGAFCGLGAAAGVAAFLTGRGELLARPWPGGQVALAALGAYFLFNVIVVEILKRRTKHRGLFHSLAVPFLYGGIWACLAAAHGGATPMAVWITGCAGVFSHLIMDAAKGLTFNPLKVTGPDIAASTRLWVITTAITLLAFTRLTKF